MLATIQSIPPEIAAAVITPLLAGGGYLARKIYRRRGENLPLPRFRGERHSWDPNTGWERIDFYIENETDQRWRADSIYSRPKILRRIKFVSARNGIAGEGTRVDWKTLNEQQLVKTAVVDRSISSETWIRICLFFPANSPRTIEILVKMTCITGPNSGRRGERRVTIQRD